jgi:hypothetical protein
MVVLTSLDRNSRDGKLLKCFAGFGAIERVLDRNTRAAKTGVPIIFFELIWTKSVASRVHRRSKQKGQSMANILLPRV